MEKQKIFENVWIRALAILCVLVLVLHLMLFPERYPDIVIPRLYYSVYFDPVVDYISKRKLIFSKKCVPRGLAIAILLTMVFLIIGGLLTYTVPKDGEWYSACGNCLKGSISKISRKDSKSD